MTADDPQLQPTNGQRFGWRPRFTLTTLLVVMLVMAVIAAGGGYLVRAATDGQQSPSSLQLTFLLFILAAPVFLMVVLSMARRIFIWLNRR